jgi:uncharacterized protein
LLENNSKRSEAPSPIVYVEIPAPNLERAGAFYSSTFGWKVVPSNLSDKPYWMFSTGEGQLTGGFDPSRRPKSGGGVILYIRVDDIDKTLRAVAAAGGRVVRDKFDVGGGYGYSAIVNDPNENEIGLWCKR